MKKSPDKTIKKTGEKKYMRDLDYLKLLSKQFPTEKAAGTEIINLRAICGLPKGTEYFFSDIHGEYESFIYLMRSASGIVRTKIDDAFGNLISNKEQLELANLIYYPRRILANPEYEDIHTPEWQKITINRLIYICKEVSSKYTRSKVRKKMPKEFAYAIDELLHLDDNDFDKQMYQREILNGIADVELGKQFIIALCELIQNLTIDQLHIIGDIFDRGPRPDIIIEELMEFHDVDIQWGNHDIDWMGAACGNEVCIASVLRIATSYNCFDVLEDGYGINIRPLSMYAEEVYKDDPCTCFKPRIWDHNVADSVDPELAAKMYKAICIIMFKLEGQLIKRHPEYELDHRLLLDKIDYKKGSIKIDGKEHKLMDMNFPTVDPKDPYKLTAKEKELMSILVYSFTHSRTLQKHIRFLYTHGALYKICNNNLLFHGCIPTDKDGKFLKLEIEGKTYKGKDLFDYFNNKIIDAYFIDGETSPKEKKDAVDLMWYLWCGPLSPLFGKDKMTTFERRFIKDKKTHTEIFNPYYEYSHSEDYVDSIFKEFKMNSEGAHVVNGHVPVRAKQGESPIRANGKLFVIDGGISKSYQSKTGIAGYTLIYNSRHLALAEHKPFEKGKENTASIQIVEQLKKRIRVKDTDIGTELKAQISDLLDLVEAYRNGDIREKGEIMNKKK